VILNSRLNGMTLITKLEKRQNGLTAAERLSQNRKKCQNGLTAAERLSQNRKKRQNGLTAAGQFNEEI